MPPRALPAGLGRDNLRLMWTRLLLVIGLGALSALGGCESVGGAAPGSIGLSFKWAQPPAQSVFVWARIEDRSGPTATIQSSAGPAEFTPGAGV